MSRTIRFRLALWYALAFSLTSALIAWIVYLYIAGTLSDRLDQSISNEVQWIVARLDRRASHTGTDLEVKDDIFEHAAFYPIKEYIEIWSESGKMFYHSPNLGQDTLLHYIEGWNPPHPVMRTLTNFRDHFIRLTVGQSRQEKIIFAMPTESITTPVSQLLKIYLWLCPVVIIVAIAGGMYVATHSLAKLNQVIETARQITIDRLHDRIPEHHAKDEIGKIVTTFNEMISRLDVSFAQMKQFSADASHELLTPLTVLRTQLETALKSNVDLDDVKNIIADCLDETLHMSTIVEDLLLLAKGEAGLNLIKHESVDLSALLEEMYEESVILGSGKSISITLDAAPNATIIGDRQRLRQMILNLIDNAIKYNRQDGSIALKLSREDSRVVLSVRDTGIGISEEEIPKIFHRFYRVDRARSRDRGGSGLGLSITKWIVEAHGGTINVSSVVNKGSEFIISFPLLPAEYRR